MASKPTNLQFYNALGQKEDQHDSHWFEISESAGWCPFLGTEEEDPFPCLFNI